MCLPFRFTFYGYCDVRICVEMDLLFIRAHENVDFLFVHLCVVSAFAAKLPKNYD